MAKERLVTWRAVDHTWKVLKGDAGRDENVGTAYAVYLMGAPCHATGSDQGGGAHSIHFGFLDKSVPASGVTSDARGNAGIRKWEKPP